MPGIRAAPGAPARAPPAAPARVARPVAGPLASSDRFGLYADDLAALADRLDHA